jgi:hypothetical protein
LLGKLGDPVPGSLVMALTAKVLMVLGTPF